MERPDIIFYQQLEQNFISFAKTKEDIRAAFIIGSRARVDHPADEWSDMDIVLYTTRPDYYLRNQDWIEGLGDLLCSFVFQTAGGDPERLNLFKNGYQVDFVIHSAEDLSYIASIRKIPDNFYRGVRVLIDKDHLSQNIFPEEFKPQMPFPISQDAFSKVTNTFWFAALYVARQILRGELWVAKMRDYDLKSLLLQMIEWHEKTYIGNDYDTWHAGRFITEWASKETGEALTQCFGRFEQTDSWQALVETAELFKKLSTEVSEKLNYTRPYALESYVSEWITQNSPLI